MSTALQVGIIGVNATRGWARESHVPAVHHLAGLELAAVATRNQQSADAAAAAFGAARAYGDPINLVNDPDIDLVTVASGVPGHRDLILAALAAGKHVYTEWPVGVDTAQTREVADAALHLGLIAAVGLQARGNPAAAEGRKQIRSGAIGRVLSVSAYATTAGFGQIVPENALYLELPETAMNLSTIQAAHTLDLALWVAGELESLSSLTTIQYPTLAAGEPPRAVARSLPDHVAVQGRLHNGGALVAEILGGRPANTTPFWLEVIGETGTLRLEGGAPRGFQSSLLTLTVDDEPVRVNPGDTAGLESSVVNVAGIYRAMRTAVLGGEPGEVPTTDDGLRLAHLIDDVGRSAQTGATVQPSGAWPH
jgi:predicted dehydrogenase